MKNTTAVELSSKLATKLESFEAIARDQNKAHGSKITRDQNGLITHVTFFYNYFANMPNRAQSVSWKFIELTPEVEVTWPLSPSYDVSVWNQGQRFPRFKHGRI